MFSNVSPFINEKSSVLEIGSYYGALGSIIKKHPKVTKYLGLELSKHGARYSNEKFDLEIVNETIEEHSKKLKYDLIILADVVEHFNNPFRDFQLLHGMLSDDGVLALQPMTWIHFIQKIKKTRLSLDIAFRICFIFRKKHSKNFV